jgi:hypothetical protein
MTFLTAKYKVAQKLIKHFGESVAIEALDKYFETAYYNYRPSTRAMYDYIWNAVTTDGVAR